MLNAQLILSDDVYIQSVATDSRLIHQPQHLLFFCLIGERFNGHQFIADLYANGIYNFVISDAVDTQNYPNANFIVVENVLNALQIFAKKHREHFSVPIFGITGSNGKTIIKEWLFQLLSPDKNVVKSPKSYNSQVGVPLSVLNLDKEHELGIFEAGISSTNQMSKLETIIQPNIGIFSNIGPAHNAGFSSMAQKVEEKLLLFKHAQQIIYCSDYELIHQQLKDRKEAVAWHIVEHHQNNYQIEIFNAKEQLRQTYNFQINFKDKASVENCIHCIVALLIVGYSSQIIQERLAWLKNLPMRLELKYGINQCTIIDDTYSADVLSLQIAIDFLNQQESKKTKTLMLSDFEESGLSATEFIDRINNITHQTKFDKLIGVGPFFKTFEQQLKNVKTIHTFLDTDSLLSSFDELNFFNELILIKGARKFEFEKVMQLLIGQTHETVLEINLNSMINNLNVYKHFVAKQVGIIAMVKAFSYGNGSVELASLLEQQGVSYLAVAYTDEGVALRRNGVKLPILVMNPDKADFKRMLQFNLEPEIYSIKVLHELIQIIDGNAVSIHIKVETGMNRLGFVEQDIDELLKILINNKHITVKTIFSHLAASEDAGFDVFTKMQIQKFEKVSSKIQTALAYSIKRHICNSAGIVRFPEAHYDFVRLGIGLYGVDGSEHIQNKLEPIGRLKTRIAQLKTVQAEDTIGYSRKGKTTRDSKIGILAIGYADGFDRRFGNGVGEVFVNGKIAKIIGNVCMDMCMVDLTDVENVKEGDEVEIYGKHISIIQQAQKIGTIPYELLTSISSRVKRIYFLD